MNATQTAAYQAGLKVGRNLARPRLSDAQAAILYDLFRDVDDDPGRVERVAA